jgi:uncharacterized membrane protein
MKLIHIGLIIVWFLFLAWLNKYVPRLVGVLAVITAIILVALPTYMNKITWRKYGEYTVRISDD